MTRRNTLDFIFDFFQNSNSFIKLYQEILKATGEKDMPVLHDVIYNYHSTRSIMNTAVSTLKRNIHYLGNAIISIIPTVRLKELIVKLKN